MAINEQLVVGVVIPNDDRRAFLGEIGSVKEILWLKDELALVVDVATFGLSALMFEFGIAKPFTKP